MKSNIHCLIHLIYTSLRLNLMRDAGLYQLGLYILTNTVMGLARGLISNMFQWTIDSVFQSSFDGSLSCNDLKKRNGSLFN